MRRGFGMDYVHGPFDSKRLRDSAIADIQQGRGCSCEKCMKKPESDRPKKLPDSQCNVFHDGAYWIASRRG